MLSSGEFFGEEELIENCRRKFSILCVHSGVIYSINKKEFLKRIFNDERCHDYIKRELESKSSWRGKRIRDFIFAKAQNNTFLQELAEYKDDMNNIGIEDIKLLLKCDTLENNDIFNISNEKNSTKEVLKSKLSAIYTMKRSFDLDSYLTLNTSTPYTIREVSKNLYDYLMNVNKKILRKKKKNKSEVDNEGSPKKLGFTILSNLKIQKSSDKKNKTYDQERLFNTTQQIEGETCNGDEDNEELKKIHNKFYCKMALPCQTETPLKNFSEKIKKLRSLKENQTYSPFTSEKNRFETILNNGNSSERKKVNKYFHYPKAEPNFGSPIKKPQFLEEISHIQDNNNLPLKFIAKLIKNNETRKLIRLKNVNKEKYIENRKRVARGEFEHYSK